MSFLALAIHKVAAIPIVDQSSMSPDSGVYGALGDGLNFNATFGDNPQPFTLSVDPNFIETTKLKASLYRLSRDVDIVDWEDGPPQHNMTTIRDYWVHNYSWAEVQDEINRKYHQYTTTVHSSLSYPYPIPIHFVHHKSFRSDAIPLLMIHGWPSTFLEWDKVIDTLTSPPNASLPAFNVVAPNLPGFGLSPAPEHAGLGPRETGQALDDLMHQLGYNNYSVYDTDLGTMVALWMVSDSKAIVSRMTDFGFATPNATDLQRYAANQTTPEETAYIQLSNNINALDTAYIGLHSTRPSLIGQLGTDSPVGFVGWQWDLRYHFSDGYPYTAQELITYAMMLYIQGTYGGIRTYKEFFQANGLDDASYPSTSVPTGIQQWPSEHPNRTDSHNPFGITPLSWLQRRSNVTYLNNDHLGDAGGHFPAEANPQAWLHDVWTFFGDGDLSGWY